MKFKLVENILNEEKMYELSTGSKYFYFVAGNKQKFNSINDVYEYLKRQSGNNETVDDKLLSELKSYLGKKFKLSEVDESNVNYTDRRIIDRLINTTFSTSRKRSHNTLVNTDKNDYIGDDNTNNNITVHHIDGIEKNNDKENLIGLPSKKVHHILHSLDLTKMGSNFQWEKEFDVLVYDGTSYKKRTLTVIAKI